MTFIACVSGPGAHDFLCIALSEEYCSAKQQPSGGRPLLLPFAKEFVPIIDHEQNSIRISPPAGLLELALAPKTKDKEKEKDKKGAKSKKKKPSKGPVASEV